MGVYPRHLSSGSIYTRQLAKMELTDTPKGNIHRIFSLHETTTDSFCEVLNKSQPNESKDRTRSNEREASSLKCQPSSLPYPQTRGAGAWGVRKRRRLTFQTN